MLRAHIQNIENDIHRQAGNDDRYYRSVAVRFISSIDLLEYNDIKRFVLFFSGPAFHRPVARLSEQAFSYQSLPDGSGHISGLSFQIVLNTRPYSYRANGVYALSAQNNDDQYNCPCMLRGIRHLVFSARRHRIV